ncbi:hypothetical protein G7047_04070 [Diaphorobacter sp. HDW4A]|uniref:hypothetical protein n=1 Tax=Diaphorobacter sp. HDW4A TaxID=2714924 RepID=UPI00140D5802|nr:hypothetical protein [Diaphorobacter sp. HDW4A]QIL79179.1 hypothetical protein G7047_04070 [Diaphorobacter sp. HDW4A]
MSIFLLDTLHTDRWEWSQCPFIHWTTPRTGIALIVIDVQQVLCTLRLGFPVVLLEDAHTSAGNAALSSQQIIAHHNATLSNSSSFGPRVTLQTVQQWTFAQRGVHAIQRTCDDGGGMAAQEVIESLKARLDATREFKKSADES